MEKNNEHQKDSHHTLRCFYCIRKTMAQIYPRDSSIEIFLLHIRDPFNYILSCLSVSEYTVAKGTSFKFKPAFDLTSSKFCRTQELLKSIHCAQKRPSYSPARGNEQQATEKAIIIK